MGFRSVPLARCDQTWRETLTLFANLFAGPVQETRLWEGGLGDALTLNHGRSAITVLLQRACGARRDVLMPSFLCPAVADAAIAAGKRPRFVDMGEDLNLDPAAVEEALDDEVAALIVPHMYGAPAPIARLEKLCRERDVLLIDDAAAAAGVRCEGRWLGSFGDAGVFSCAQQKSLVAGQGGLLLCNSDRVREALHGLELPGVRRLRTARQVLSWLWSYRWHHRLPRLRYYLDRLRFKLGLRRVSVQGPVPAKLAGVYAAVLRVQLLRMPGILEHRRRNCRGLFERLSSLPDIVVPQYYEGCMLTRFIVRTPGLRWERDSSGAFTRHPVALHLERRRVETARPYMPLHWLAPFGSLDRGSLSRTERIVPELLALPVQGPMSDRDLDVVAEAVRSFFLGRNLADSEA